jgi:hypothetical protein
MEPKDEFLDIFYDNIDRDGADKFLEWLEKSDFFTAPASTKRHSAYKGGLCQHSINVYKRFVKILEGEYGPNWSEKVSPESVAIMGLLHDVCKVDTYVEDMKNVKVDGAWVQKPYYKVEDSLPYGHGEKSVYIISAFMKLSREEALAINWHMGEYDQRVQNGSYIISDVFYKYPVCFMLHLADLTATYLDEEVTE